MEPSHASALYGLRLCVPARSFPPFPRRGHAMGTTKMTRELKPGLDPLSGPERLTLFCVASRMDTGIAGLPDGIADLLVMKKLARRDQARLRLTDQGQAALHTLLGLGGGENRDRRDARVRTPMPPSLALARLIRRRLMALAARSRRRVALSEAARGRRPVALGDLDVAVAAVSLRSKCRHPCGRSKQNQSRS